MDDQIPTLEEDDETEITWNLAIEVHDKFPIMDAQSFVGICAKSSHPEMFHLMKVEDKKIADPNIIDSSGLHCVLKGELYLLEKWFSFQNETNKFACYKESKNRAGYD